VRRRWSRSSRVYMAAAVVLSTATAAGLRIYLSDAASAAALMGPQMLVVVADVPIARGATLSTGALRVAMVPARYAQPGSLSRVDQAAGRVALADLAPGEAVTRTRLARVRAGPVASLVPEGLRAFSVPTSLPAAAVRAGDHVDVLATFNASAPHTEAVVMGVEVLFVLGSEPASSAGPASGEGLGAAVRGGAATTLLILVSPEQERSLAYARAFADLEVTVAPAESES
jgi:Flp pilus assembly protein CpaB